MVQKNEINEAAEAMILLSKQTVYDTENKNSEIFAILRGFDSTQQWEYVVRNEEFDIRESGAILRFTYNPAEKKWKGILERGSVKVNSIEYKSSNRYEKIVEEGCFFDFGDFGFKFHYQSKCGRNKKSYQKLIIEAINSVKEKKMTLSQIYSYFINNCGFSDADSVTWKNSIRHNLSLNKIFKKIPRTANETQGKGMFWTVDMLNSKLQKNSKKKDGDVNFKSNIKGNNDEIKLLDKAEDDFYRKRMLSLSRSDFVYSKNTANQEMRLSGISVKEIDHQNCPKLTNNFSIDDILRKDNQRLNERNKIENSNSKKRKAYARKTLGIFSNNRNKIILPFINSVKRKIIDNKNRKKFKSNDSSKKIYNFNRRIVYLESSDNESSSEELVFLNFEKNRESNDSSNSRTRSSSIIDLPDEFYSMSLNGKKKNDTHK